MPPEGLEAYRKASINPARWDDWPDGWGEPGCDPDPMSVAKIVKDYEHSDAHDIQWNDDGLRLLALFSNDSHMWLTLRSHLAGAVRAAADFKGKGEVAITGYLDGGPSDVYRIVARADGTSEMDILTARDAKPIAERLYKEAQPLVEKMLARYQKVMPKKPRAAGSAEVHARVCAALRACPPDKIMAEAANETRTFANPKTGAEPTRARLHQLFPNAKDLLDALEHGWASSSKGGS